MKKLLLFASFLLATISVSAQEIDSLRISFLGDSYTTFEGHVSPTHNAIWYFEGGKRQDNDVVSVEQTWWYQVVEALGAKLDKNNSYSGATISNFGYRNEDYSDRSFVSRMFNLGHPDLILVCGGTNDSWAGAPVGEYKYEGISNEDLFSFRPAMAYLLGHMKVLYPHSRIIFILNTELREEINESVHTVCAHYGVECLDLKDIDKGSGHPSVAGMKSFAEQVLKQIER